MPTRNRKPLPPIETRQWLIAEEAAAFIGVSVATLYRFTRGEVAGVPKLPSLPRGSKARVWRKEALEDWMRQCEAAA